MTKQHGRLASSSPPWGDAVPQLPPLPPLDQLLPRAVLKGSSGGVSFANPSETTLTRDTANVTTASLTPRSTATELSLDNHHHHHRQHHHNDDDDDDDDDDDEEAANGPRSIAGTAHVLQEKAALRWNAEEELKRVSRELLRVQKWALVTGLVVVNATLISVSLLLPQATYLFLVLLSCNTMLQAGMVVCITANAAWRGMRRVCGGGGSISSRKGTLLPVARPVVAEAEAAAAASAAESMVMLLPCYNETRDELARSLDSLVRQRGLEHHRRLMLIVVDGRVRGPGMAKTTHDYLLEDILPGGPTRRFDNGYRARDGLPMAVTTRAGRYRGVPYVFVGKRHNQGKRDSLCFARSLLFHVKRAAEAAGAA
ncbi:hypothetical protein E4U41_004981, partial [Claviceps citrina]